MRRQASGAETMPTANGCEPSWKQIELGQVLTEAQYGLSLRGNSAGHYPILRMNCQVDGRVVFRDLQYVELNDQEFGRFCLVDGDLLFNRTNSFELVGRTALYEGESPAVFASYLIRLRVDTKILVPAFLNYFLNVDFTQAALKAFATKGVSQSNISASKLRTLMVPVPPILEQRAIARVLSKIQSAVQVQTKIVAGLRELKAATMAKLFREGLCGERRKQTEIGEIPKSWGTRPLSECALVQTGIAKGRKVEGEEAAELPYLRVANVQDGFLDLSEVKTIVIPTVEIRRYLLQTGDVLLTEGGDFDKLGRGYIWKGQIADCVHQNHIFAVRTDKSSLLPEFFAYQAQSPYGKAYFLKVAHKTTNLACINSSKLKEFPVLLPELNEQRQIAHVLESIAAKSDIESHRLGRLRTLFSSTLHLLMTGQVRVPVGKGS